MAYTHNPPRSADEAVLRALSAWRQGGDEQAINHQLGRNSTYVRTMVRRISQADLEQSGEPREAVLPFYRRGRR